jgi:UDP-N-acetylmuramoyl-tripeptide--D-alanyl-D-alanine ligase
MIAAVLMQPEAQAILGSVGKAPDNMNDNVGLPLAVLGYAAYPKVATLLQGIRETYRLAWRTVNQVTATSYPKVLVLEYAASWNGDIPRLAKLAPPTVAVVTAIGPGHLERFETVERVAAEKGALVHGVLASGLVVLGADNADAARLASETPAHVVKVPGRGRELSAGIASVVGRHFGVADNVISRAIATFEGPIGRLQLSRLASLTLIDDSFNANPLSMQLALDVLAETSSAGQRRLAILGTMEELGKEVIRYHSEIGVYARARAEVIIGVGALAQYYRPDSWFATAEECAAHLPSLVAFEDCVLVKGSHSNHLDRIVTLLKQFASRDS